MRDVHDIEDFMTRLIAAEKGEAIESELSAPTPLNHDFDYALHTWLDHRKHGGYPEEGGYLNQDPDLMADWFTLTLYHIRLSRGISDLPPIQMNNEPQNWANLMGD